jgi:hypothetical protein
MKRKVSIASASKPRVWKRKALNITKKLRSGQLFLNLNDSSTAFLPSDSIRAISTLECESAQRNLLLKCMADAEVKSAGSSYVMLSMLHDVEADVPTSGRRFNIDDLRESLLFFSGKLASDIVIDSVLTAGRKGKILLDSNLSSSTEIVFGSQACKWKPDSSFFASINLSKISVSNCKVIFIDGIIESVAECHHLFQFSYDKKIPLVIFSRGFAEEVNSTAALNFQRQTAQLIPIIVPFDEVGVNSLGDLAACFGSEVVSSDKGQLISSIKVDECKSALKVTATPNFTEIEFFENRTDEVVSSLSEKIKSKNEAEADLLRKRIDALGSGSITIRVGSDQKSTSGFIRDRIDFGIRFVKSCMSNGMVDFYGIKIPSSSLKVGVEHARSFISILESCGCVLEVDRHVD